MGRKIQYCQDVIFPCLINRFNIIPIKIPGSCFMDIKKLVIKFTWESIHKRSGIANTILNEKNKAGGVTLYNFKTY